MGSDGRMLVGEAGGGLPRSGTWNTVAVENVFSFLWFSLNWNQRQKKKKKKVKNMASGSHYQTLEFSGLAVHRVWFGFPGWLLQRSLELYCKDLATIHLYSQTLYFAH